MEKKGKSERGGRTPQRGARAEYGSDKLNRQNQSEGTPQGFDPSVARRESRNIVGGREREHLSDAKKLDDEELEQDDHEGLDGEE